jgi:phosphorylase kinase alpha/beta subunit
MDDLPGEWSHAQNDALGYFLWFYCKMIPNNGDLKGDAQADALIRFAVYFLAISYWEDEDSGHWEERRKLSASSVGTVVAGLWEFKAKLLRSAALKRRLDQRYKEFHVSDQLIARVRSTGSWAGTLENLLEGLINKGVAMLRETLPCECLGPSWVERRHHDAALLFLLYPLNVPDVLRAVLKDPVWADEIENQILRNVRTHLEGEYGIRRYVRDSFWCRDYKKRLAPELRTADFSTDQELRDTIFQKPEAEWCIFDPILSAYYRARYERYERDERTPSQDDQEKQRRLEVLRLEMLRCQERQRYHLYRALAQVTGSDCPAGPFKCPELYYSEDGRMQPGDAIPLLWTQANLWIALVQMEKSLRRTG